MASLKQQIRKAVPKSLLNGYREFKLKFFLEGGDRECLFCKRNYKKFKPHGLEVPVLARLQVVSGGTRLTTCPRCSSSDRERLIYLYLQRHTHVMAGRIALLDIAPSDNLAKVLKEVANMRYVSGDLLRTDVMEKVDVTAMQFADESFDVMLCNHVMEHVPDDRKAMREIRRVLKPGGWAMMMVPYSLVLEDTIEDPTVETDEERLEKFGQEDHIRIYALQNYLARLRESGLEPEVIRVQVDDEEVNKFGLLGERDVIVAHRPVNR
jgi:SAM-dependent methyltransferase